MATPRCETAHITAIKVPDFFIRYFTSLNCSSYRSRSITLCWSVMLDCRTKTSKNNAFYGQPKHVVKLHSGTSLRIKLRRSRS